ncbi:MAG: helix-turn-helix domain-containing protein, partial [Actinobacteria bacterium]|nr:helix-turn-helix domain-containing protein [Actinomycetota bacterium]
MAPDSLLSSSAGDATIDRLLLGKRIRHFRTRAGLTLDALGERVGVVGSQLSLIENGRREPRLSLLQGIARELGVDPADLLAAEAPDRRSALEIELERAQKSPLYQQLQLPHVRTPRTLNDEALESLVGLHRELTRRSRAAAATPEEARRANTEIRLEMRGRDNYLPEIAKIAEDLMSRIGHTTGAVTHREVAVLAELLGFTLIFVDDLPSNTRS